MNCDAALLSPSTGIIGSHAFMLALQGDAEAAGAACAFHTPLLHAKALADRIELDAGGNAPISLECKLSAIPRGFLRPGSRAASTAFRTDLLPPAILPKGTYLLSTPRPPFHRLTIP